MLRIRIVEVTLCLSLFAGVFSAQGPDKVDFARDVQPIFLTLAAPRATAVPSSAGLRFR